MRSKQQAFLWVFILIAAVFGTLWQFYPLPDAQERLDYYYLLQRTRF